MGYTLIKYALKTSHKNQLRIGNYIGYFISLTVVFWTIYKYSSKNFDITRDLPFHLCYFIALLLPIFTTSRKKIIYDILLFWILAGTVQAIITPELKYGFPHIHFFKFWIVHGGLIIAIFYATFIYKMRPNLKSVLISFIAIQGYFIFAILINKLTGANYFYLNAKPSAPSILDYLGDWPNYIIVAELFLVPYFLLIYVPFYLTNKKKS